jgi:hypothetical protein
LIFLVAMLNRAIDENTPLGSSGAPAMARPSSLAPEIAPGVDPTGQNIARLRYEVNIARLRYEVNIVTKALLAQISEGETELACRLYSMQIIANLGYVLWDKINDRRVMS